MLISYSFIMIMPIAYVKKKCYFVTQSISCTCDIATDDMQIWTFVGTIDDAKAALIDDGSEITQESF